MIAQTKANDIHQQMNNPAAATSLPMGASSLPMMQPFNMSACTNAMPWQQQPVSAMGDVQQPWMAGYSMAPTTSVKLLRPVVIFCAPANDAHTVQEVRQRAVASYKGTGGEFPRVYVLRVLSSPCAVIPPRAQRAGAADTTLVSTHIDVTVRVLVCHHLQEEQHVHAAERREDRVRPIVCAAFKGAHSVSARKAGGGGGGSAGLTKVEAVAL